MADLKRAREPGTQLGQISIDVFTSVKCYCFTIATTYPFLKMFAIVSTHVGDNRITVHYYSQGFLLAFIIAFPLPTPCSCCLAVVIYTAQ